MTISGIVPALLFIIMGQNVLCDATGPDLGRRPSYYWSRALTDHFSQRSSHIGPVPHLNPVMTEWGMWGSWSECSRPCNTGVRVRVRHCITSSPRVMPGSGIRTSHDQCGGSNTQYDACNNGPCGSVVGQYGGGVHAGGLSFRAAQCRQYNNRKVFGRLVTRWLPYTQGVQNPCALVCEGEGEGIVYTFGKVTDGTHCRTNQGLLGLCVNGRCLRMSCDGKLGGTALEDQCRVCGGRNTTCTLHKGVFHTPGQLQATTERPRITEEEPFAYKTSNTISSSSSKDNRNINSGTNSSYDRTNNNNNINNSKYIGNSAGNRDDNRINNNKNIRNIDRGSIAIDHRRITTNKDDARSDYYKEEDSDSESKSTQGRPNATHALFSSSPDFSGKQQPGTRGALSASGSSFVGRGVQLQDSNTKRRPNVSQIKLGDKSADREQLAADQPAVVTEISSSQAGPVGYYEVTEIPKGATNVRVTDTSHNFIALREGKKFLLNGEWLIDWPGEIEAAGAMFLYNRAENDSEILTALGPTKTDLSLMILLREDNPGVYYEYWTPNKPLQQYSYAPSSNLHHSRVNENNNRTKLKYSHPPVTSQRKNPDNSNSVSNINQNKKNRTKLENSTSVINDHSAPESRHFHRKERIPKKRHQHSLERHWDLPQQISEAFNNKHWKKSSIISEETQSDIKQIPLNLSSVNAPGNFRANTIVENMRTNNNVDREISNQSKNRKRSKILSKSSSSHRTWRRGAKRRNITSKRNNPSFVRTHSILNNNLQSSEAQHNRKRKTGKKMLFRKRKGNRRKKNKKKKGRDRKARPACSKCPRVREVKKHFCTSDFVSRIEVLNFEAEVSDEKGTPHVGGRYEVTIHQSFKNTVPLLHKEFIWVPSFPCVCPKLKAGKVYLVMGSTHSSGQGREVRLGLDASSYTRRFTTRVLDRVLKIRNYEMKNCRKWRQSAKKPHFTLSFSGNNSYSSALFHNTKTDLPSHTVLKEIKNHKENHEEDTNVILFHNKTIDQTAQTIEKESRSYNENQDEGDNINSILYTDGGGKNQISGILSFENSKPRGNAANKNFSKINDNHLYSSTERNLKYKYYINQNYVETNRLVEDENSLKKIRVLEDNQREG